MKHTIISLKLFLLLVILGGASSLCFAEERGKDFFVKEYIYFYFLITMENTYPEIYSFMLEPSDTIFIDTTCPYSLLRSLYKQGYEWNEMQNGREYYKIFGPYDEAASTYFFDISCNNAYYQLNKPYDLAIFKLKSGHSLYINYNYANGVFLIYEEAEAAKIISMKLNCPQRDIRFIFPISFPIFRKNKTLIIIPL